MTKEIILVNKECNFLELTLLQRCTQYLNSKSKNDFDKEYYAMD